jgi:hypothetical protein
MGNPPMVDPNGEYEKAYAYLYSYMTDQKNLKRCAMLHCHL